MFKMHFSSSLLGRNDRIVFIITIQRKGWRMVFKNTTGLATYLSQISRVSQSRFFSGYVHPAVLIFSRSRLDFFQG